MIYSGFINVILFQSDYVMPYHPNSDFDLFKF